MCVLIFTSLRSYKLLFIGWQINHGVTEQMRLSGTSGCHLVKQHCSSRDTLSRVPRIMSRWQDSPDPFLQSCLPAGWSPAGPGAWGCSFPGEELSSAEFHEIFVSPLLQTARVLLVCYPVPSFVSLAIKSKKQWHTTSGNCMWEISFNGYNHKHLIGLKMETVIRSSEKRQDIETEISNRMMWDMYIISYPFWVLFSRNLVSR